MLSRKTCRLFTLLGSLLAGSAVLTAGEPTSNFLTGYGSEYELICNNRPLVKINGKTISVLDVQKRMDLNLQERLKNKFTTPLQTYQYYMQNWKSVLHEMVNNELILMEADDFKVALSDGEIHEELEKRFGPHVFQKLETLHLTHEEAEEIVKTDMVVRNMLWFRVWARVLQKVTPEMIKSTFEERLVDLPKNDEWIYQTITFRGGESVENVAKEAYVYLQDFKKEADKALEEAKTLMVKEGDAPTKETLLPKPKSIQEMALQIANSLPSDIELSLSEPLCVKEKDLSIDYLTVLKQTEEQTFSPPILQKSRTEGKDLYRIFYLIEHKREPLPSFDLVTPKIKEELLDRYGNEHYQAYLQKLKKRYGFENSAWEPLIPEDFQPFSIASPSTSLFN